MKTSIKAEWLFCTTAPTEAEVPVQEAIAGGAPGGSEMTNGKAWFM